MMARYSNLTFSLSGHLMKIPLAISTVLLCSHAYSQTPMGVTQVALESSPFAGLKIGQRVNLAEKPGGLIEIQIFDDGKVGTHIVSEIYLNFIVLNDTPHITKRWIPITSIQAVVNIKSRQ